MPLNLRSYLIVICIEWLYSHSKVSEINGQKNPYKYVYQKPPFLEMVFQY